MLQSQINVSPETARAFEAASPKQQRRAEVAMLQILIGRKAAIERLGQIMDELSANARARGLTEELLDELLNDRE